MWYFVVMDFIARKSHKCQYEVKQLSCLVGGTPTEEPFCVVLTSSLRKKSKLLLRMAECQN